MTRRTVLRAGAAVLAAAPIGSRVSLAAISGKDLETLRAKLAGSLVLPADPPYETLRRVHSFNPDTDKRPLAIVRCAHAGDVARAIEFARSSGLDLAVRGGGHDVLGASGCEGGVLIDLSDMTVMAIDADRRTARVGAGASSGAFNLAAGAHGLAPVLGCNPSVGVAGLTLGGGIGWFPGTHGAACDHLIAAELVTADSRTIRASEEENPDLFWALRGGGGNFGAVTTLDFRLAPIDTVLGGSIAFRADRPELVASFLRFCRDFMSAAPDELTVELGVFSMGLPLAGALVCWSGAEEEGARQMARLRSFATPVFDSVRRVPYPHLTDSPSSGASTYGFWRGGSLDALGDGAIAELARFTGSAPPGWRIGLGHHLHGQIARVPETATPFIRRAGQLAYFVSAGWNDTAQAEASMSWVRDAMAAMRPWSSARTYVNYLSDDSQDAVRAAYGTNYEKLQTVKRRYDPTNVFHHNRNIVP